MTGEIPTISVIIPTHDRGAVLERTLAALCAQTYPPKLMEVLLVADGCTDDTVERMRRYCTPFPLHVIEQPNQGPAVARNQGAAQAKGKILVFLDDDIEAAPHLIETYARIHQNGPGQVAIGYLPPILQEQKGFFRLSLLSWWEEVFSAMRQSNYRYTFRNLLSGNFSLEATLFTQVGGFDSAFRCHEDYELGVRLLNAGASFTFAEEALGHHHDKTGLARLLHRKYEEGRADVQLGRRHPQLRPTLTLARFATTQSRRTRLLRTLAFVWPTVGNFFAFCGRWMLDLLEWGRIRSRWRGLFENLLDYWYWRGVAEELRTRRALANFLQSGPIRSEDSKDEIELDLGEGLEAAEQRLDEERPTSARLRYGQYPIGHIPSEVGAEPLRGIHLRPILATIFAWPLLRALTLERAMAFPLSSDHLFADFSGQTEEPVYADKST